MEDPHPVAPPSTDDASSKPWPDLLDRFENSPFDIAKHGEDPTWPGGGDIGRDAESHVGAGSPADGAVAGSPADGSGSRWGRELIGKELRWFLTVTMVDRGEPMKVRDLVQALDDAGFTVAGRASKVISDSLRWERGRGRVKRLARGVYVASTRIPRSTMRRLRRRVAEFAARVPRPIPALPLRPPRPRRTRPRPEHNYRLPATIRRRSSGPLFPALHERNRGPTGVGPRFIGI